MNNEYYKYLQQLQAQALQQEAAAQSSPPMPGDPSFVGPLSPQIQPVQVTAQPRPKSFFPSRVAKSMARGGGHNMTDAQKRGVYTPAEQAQFRTDRNQGIGKMLLGLSDAFAGRPIEQGFMQRQQYEQQQNEIQKKKAQYEAVLNDPSLPPDQRRLLESLGWQGMDSFLMKKYELDNRIPTKPDLQRLGVYDTSGNQVGTVLRSNVQGIAGLEKEGYLIGNMSSPTTTPQSDNNDSFDVIFNRQKNTGQLINVVNDTAKKMYDEPESALRIGTTAQFIDGVIKNVDEGLKLIGKKEESENWKEYASKGIDKQGNDFSSRISEVSRETGVIESNIRDLAYLFAAARGQEGRGLSDKDYENALAIVSGGVGAENRIAVLQDVAKRFKSQALYDLGFMKDYYSDNPEMMARFNKIPELPDFINPFDVTVQQGSSPTTTAQTADEIIKEMEEQGRL